MVKKAHADHIIHTTNGNYLSVDYTKAPYNNIQAIMLDPTCSGSGMINRLESQQHMLKQQDKKERLDAYEKTVKLQSNSVRHG